MLRPKPERIAKGMWWDRAWSLVEGCTKCGPECLHCWAERQAMMRRNNPAVMDRLDGAVDGDGFTGRIRCQLADITKPTPRQRPAVWAVWNDLFHEDVPAYLIVMAFQRMAECRQHFFIVCTKRPERAGRIVPQVLQGIGAIRPLPNVMGMTTAGNQEMADLRIPHLLRSPFEHYGLSAEPLLGDLNLRPSWLFEAHTMRRLLSWVVIGGESGPGERPFSLNAARSVVRQCKDAGVPCFVKQLGARPFATKAMPTSQWPKSEVEFGIMLKDRKGADMGEWPEDLRIREFPTWNQAPA